MSRNADGSPFRTIGARFPASTVDAVAVDAERLGLTQSEWMRMAVEEQIAREAAQETAEKYRRPASRAEEKARRRADRAAATNGAG